MDSDYAQIDSILNARSMAVVGASGKPGKFGSVFVLTQLAMGFDGSLYLVNPGEKEIFGRPAFPDLSSLPEVPDLVYLTIPAHLCMDVLEDCGRLGVKGVIVVAAGFRELGAEGEALEGEALRIAREGGFRIIGPNCFGIYNARNGLTLLPGHDLSRTPGDTAFLSQSGGFSVHVARMGNSLGIHFSAVVSYGNGADLNETDFLRYFARDPRTSYIAAYLEGVRNARPFLAALREAAGRKPVILWKVGGSAVSRQAVRSHTGSLAGSAEIWKGAMAQAGAIPASGVDEVLDVLIALRHLGRRPGRRLLLAGGGGGLGTYGADLAEGEGLEVPPLDPGSAAALKEILKRAGAVVANPLDIGTPLIPLPLFGPSMKEAAGNRSTDILVFDLALNFGRNMIGEERLGAAADALALARKDSGKPVAVVLYSRSCDTEDMATEQSLRCFRSRLLGEGIAVFPSMPRAMRAIALANGGCP
ncbi:MAG: CoA-binding protein [bacterium]